MLILEIVTNENMLIIKWILYLIFFAVIAFIFFLLYASLTNFRPEQETVQIVNEKVTPITDSISISLVSWNIGYAGLDSSMDFFYDGGEKVRTTKEASLRNLEGILKTIQNYQSFDFLLLQEVDIRSKRSYKVNQYEIIGNNLPGYSSSMGINYKVKFVPMPPTNPLGVVYSGVATFSKNKPAKSVRHSFPGNYSWPMSVFMLDRCFLINEYPLQSGHNLIVINTHNSAYDDGSLRHQQMDYLKSILLNFYKKGDYVIVGGDWNQCPYGFKPAFDGEIFDDVDLINVDENYPEVGWKWAYDSSIPTNRRLKIPYQKGTTATTLIDYFLLSPNIEIEKVNGRILGFEFSDHQPVEIKIKLLPNSF